MISILKKILGDVDALSVYNFLKSSVGDFRRPAGNAPTKPEEKGGMFSQNYALLLQEIQEEDNGTTHGLGDRIVEAMDGFYRFLFPSGGIIAWLYDWVFGTRYRIFLTTLPVTPGKPGTPAVPATPASPPSRRNPTGTPAVPATPAIPATPAKDTRKILVRWMASVILSENNRDAGYRKLLTVLRNRQVPTGIQLPAGWLNRFESYVSTVWATTQRWARDTTDPVNIQAVETAIQDGLRAARRVTFCVLGIVAIVVALLVAVATYVNLTGGAL